jgi:pimeloyl-ACP methyl ester carboxylesterase
MTMTSSKSIIKSADGTPIAYQSLGAGPGVIVVGGALRSGDDYVPFAQAVAKSFAVHVVDRRGRGVSGPQGPDYSIEKECEDLLAVQATTGATAVFGHSYGGFVALEAARRSQVFSMVAAYEPGVSVNGSIRVDWMPRYRELLAVGDTRGAFACFVRKSGMAPSPIAKMPLWYVRAILRLVIRKRQWHDMEPLLQSNLAEHEQEVLLDDGTVDRYRSITARVLLMGGRRSPAFITTELFHSLQGVIADSSVDLLNGLDHNAPDEKAPQVVGEQLRCFLCQPDRSRPSVSPQR